MFWVALPAATTKRIPALLAAVISLVSAVE